MSHMSEVFVFGQDRPVVEIQPGVFRKTLSYSDSLMVCEIHLVKGAAVPPHQHVHEQSSYVISGKLIYTVDGEGRLLEAGNAVMLASNVLHSAEAVEDTLLIDVFSPLREEYL